MTPEYFGCESFFFSTSNNNRRYIGWFFSFWKNKMDIEIERCYSDLSSMFWTATTFSPSWKNLYLMYLSEDKN